MPFANEVAPPSDAFKAHQASGFANWKLTVDGMVAHPTASSLTDLRHLAVRSQITEVVCEEGGSYIAQWIGAPLSDVLRAAGILPQARYIIYYSIDRDWWDRIDIADALHPPTFLTWGVNEGDLAVPFAGPLRLRVPRRWDTKASSSSTTSEPLIRSKASGKG